MEVAAKFLASASKPVLVVGPKTRPAHAVDAVRHFADACGALL